LKKKPRITILNDTVATLLAGKSAGLARRYSNYVGFILGTGTNTAYVSPHAAIKKVPGLPANGAMTINVESGSFGGVPQTELDKVFDATTADAGSYTFEKMISGAYLGGVGRAVLQAAATEGLFSDAAKAALLACAVMPNKDLDDFCANPFETTGVLAAMPLTDDDRRVVMALCKPVFERAALLAAINIAAAVLQTGGGKDPLHPVCATVDGSTYYRNKAVNLRSLVEAHLRDILGRRGVFYDLVQIDDAPMIGAAVAGLTR
jgi:hexokinase